MKSKFSNFYPPTPINTQQLETIWNSADTIFIFDTNTLLGLYRYSKETQKEFLTQLAKIKDKIWMPYHVGLEFHQNRLSAIKQNQDQIKEIDEIKDIISVNYKNINSFQDKFKKADHQGLYSTLDKLKSSLTEKKKEMEDTIESYKKELKTFLTSDEEFKPHFSPIKDKIIEQISILFTKEKIGNNLYDTQSKIDQLFVEAKERWSLELPPGYLDYENKKDKYFLHDELKYYNALGDLIIFNEIKLFCKENNKKNIFFISNDVKEDWKFIIKYEGIKDLGVHPKLHKELVNFIEDKNIIFDILTTKKLLEYANEITGTSLNQTIIHDLQRSITHIPITESTDHSINHLDDHLHIKNNDNEDISNKDTSVNPEDIINIRMSVADILREIKLSEEQLNELYQSRKQLYRHIVATYPDGYQIKNNRPLSQIEGLISKTEERLQQLKRILAPLH